MPDRPQYMQADFLDSKTDGLDMKKDSLNNQTVKTSKQMDKFFRHPDG